jgi:hypothetical protein
VQKEIGGLKPKKTPYQEKSSTHGFQKNESAKQRKMIHKDKNKNPFFLGQISMITSFCSGDCLGGLSKR